MGKKEETMARIFRPPVTALTLAVSLQSAGRVVEEWIDGGIEEFSPDRAGVCLNNLPADNIQRMSPIKDRRRIERMKRAMLRGEWQVNPNSRMLFGRDDVLLDGRGRLTAVKESGVTIHSYVSRNWSRVDATGLVVDQGISRDSSYVLQQPARLVRAANVAFVLLKSRPPDVGEITPFAEQFYPVYRNLALESRRGFGTSAAVQLAAMLTVIARRASIQYMDGILTLFGRRDPRNLPPLPYSFYRQCTFEGLSQRAQLFRGFRAFEERKQDVGRLQIKDLATVINEVRHLLRVAVPEWR